MSVAVPGVQRRAHRARYSIDVVGKVFDILQVFIDQGRPALSFTEILERVTLTKNAVFRLLVSLVESGYLRKRTDDGKYVLSLKCVELGRAARLSNDIRRIALPYMRELWHQFEDTANLAVLDDGQICYLEVLESPHRFKLVASPGDRDPAHCTALGKAMLAYLPPGEVKAIMDLRGMQKMTSNTITTRAELEAELVRVRQQG